MSSIKLSPNASGTGEFTIAAPNSNTNRTLTLPDQTGTVLTNAGPFTANASASAGAVTIDASNNVGIGTSSPDSGISSTQTVVQIQNGNVAALSLNNTAGGGGRKYTLYSGVAGQLAFYDVTAAAERARIDSSGNLLVNTTGTSYGEKFAVVNSGASANLAYFLFNSANDRDALIVRHLNATGGTAGTMLSFLNASGTAVGSIRSNVSATAYNTSSDYRLKENIQPMTGALTKVAALKPVTYKWKVNGFDGQGFIAHELQEVVPECVTGEKDAVDAEGNPIYQGIDTSFLVATLTAAIQELNAKVEAQAAEIAALKGAQ